MTDGPIWLVRHAQTDWTGRRWCGRSDPVLSPEGRAAARRLAADLAGEIVPGTVIVSSPARRATETASAIADGSSLVIEIDVDLAEVDFGLIEGWTWDELEERRPDLAATIARGDEPDWPGGEPAASVARRAAHAADRVLARAQAGSGVVVVSHGGLLRRLAAVLQPGAAIAPVEPAGVRRLELGPAGWAVVEPQPSGIP